MVVYRFVKALVVLGRPARRFDALGRRIARHAARELAKIIEIALRRADRVVVERDLGAVLSAIAKDPECQRIDSRRAEIAQQRELARALADLGSLLADQECV